MTDTSKIIYTKTDEAPALATYSLLPIIKTFTDAAGVEVEMVDISLAARIIANFPDKLTEVQKLPDTLKLLGDLCLKPEANIIKLPNISASIPQLGMAIKELQAHGYNIPDFPMEPKSEAEKDIKNRYAKVLGSAVNPVLREGNSDRRVAAAVKQYAKDNPHSMGAWKADSKSHIAYMTEGDFYGSEKSYVAPKDGAVKIELVKSNGDIVVLKEKTALKQGEVIDGSLMSKKALRAFYAKEIESAKKEDVLLSLHLKATMMKVSDPIMFGHAVTVFYSEVFEKYAELFKELGVDATNGLGDVYAKIAKLPQDKQEEIEAAIQAVYKVRPQVAMVNSDKGITNFHVPSDVIIDASLPATLRSSGKMWGADGKLKDTKAMVPDRCYAGIYQEVFEFCKKNGAFDVTTMGNVSNVGLMAKKAEEYGSHDKTFHITANGTVRVVDTEGKIAFEHKVEEGDIWRMCQTQDVAVKDWVKLAVNRAKATGNPTIFWLDEQRAHDVNIITKVNAYLQEHDTKGLDIKIMNPLDAMQYSLKRVKAGQDTISVTGNVLRDYLTDLFPILELGTSAKMLSIVPLLAGGGMYETGAGGSAPKHVEQFIEEGHLRWDSLGEFLALAVSLEDLATKTGNQKALIIAKALDKANSKFLMNDKSPSRRVKEPDNRTSHFYLALYWAKAIAEQTQDVNLQRQFAKMVLKLKDNEARILQDFIDAQGGALNIGGYFQPNEEMVTKAMRPSEVFNKILASV